MHEIRLDIIDSTNTYGKLHVGEFPHDQITCITAEEQTAGRGRYHRKWISPRGVNIYATFCFRLQARSLHLGCLGHLMACSLTAVLIKMGFNPKIKWPNDIQLNQKKLSGILCETQFHKDLVDVFLGIGININLDAKTAASIDQPATSLLIETGKEWDREEVLKKLQKQFEIDLSLFKKEGFTPFHDRFERLMAYIGKTIRIFDGETTWTGICHSLSPDGQLNLLMPNHIIQKIATGDILIE